MAFSDPMHEEFATMILGAAPYGGGDVGEVQALEGLVKAGDDGSFYDAFVSSRVDAWRRATPRWRRGTVSVHVVLLLPRVFLPVHGLPPVVWVAPRPAARRGVPPRDGSLQEGVALFDRPGEKLEIPYEGTTMPAYFLRAHGCPDDVRPLLILSPGWDSTLGTTTSRWARRRCDGATTSWCTTGPVRVSLLIDQGIPLRYDWEKVRDAAHRCGPELPLVDPDRITFESCSLGGYFAPRAAAYEHRLAAIICDPGQIDVGVKFFDLMKSRAERRGVRQAAGDRPRGHEEDHGGPGSTPVPLAGRSSNAGSGPMARLTSRRCSSRWPSGSWNLKRSRRSGARRSSAPQSPSFASTNSKELLDALTCPKTFVEFKDADEPARTASR